MLRTQKDHNKAFRITKPATQLLMDTIADDGNDLEIRTPDANIEGSLDRIKEMTHDRELTSLTIMAHGHPKKFLLGAKENTGLYRIENVAGKHFHSLKEGAPIYLVSCATAEIGRKIAEESHHPVYAPTKPAFTERTFLVPNQQGTLELVQWGAQGERITRLFRYDGDVLVESEPEAYERAFAYLQAKAHEGHAAAQFALGEFYWYGKEVEQSYDKAAEWFARSAKQRHAPSRDMLESLARFKNCSQAAYELGVIHAEGIGVKKSQKKAVEWLSRAARNGHIPSIEMLKNLALKGSLDAASELSSMYSTGYGVEQSDKEAAKWFAIAAGHTPPKDCCTLI